MKKIIVLVLLFGLFNLVGGLGPHLARAATTNLDVVMSAGSLTLTSSGSASLSGLTVSTSAATSTGSIANVSVTDTRGSGAGWSVTMTSQHFTTRATHTTILDTDSDGITGFTGTYDGLDGVLDPNGTFIVEIVETGGAVGTAVFQFTDPTGTVSATSTTATGSGNVLSNGITIDWDDAATYDIGDKFSAGVDVFPYTEVRITPGSVTAASGSLDGVTAGSAEFLSGTGATSDAKTLITADVNKGFGDYDQAPTVDVGVHANSLSGTFIADAVITAA